MDMAGNSYLEAICIMNIFDSDTKIKDCQPKSKKHRDTEEKISFSPLHLHGLGLRGKHLQGGHC